MTPTARTLAHLRQLGYLAAVVERWNAFGRVRQDLFGFADVLAIRADEPGPLAIQTTTRSHQAHRLAKALATPALGPWLACGGRFEVWGWALVGPRGKRKRWEVKRRAVEDLTEAA